MRSIVIMAASILVLLLLLLFMAPTFSNSEAIETLPVSGYHRLYLGFDVIVGAQKTIRSFYGSLEAQLGPFTINYANSTTGDIPALELNPYAWTKVANIIFLDQPVGTGFSYSKTWEASLSTDTLSAQQTYSFLIQWLLDHPKFLSNPLYITGDSYSGIIIPLIVRKIYDGLESGIEPRLNMKGYVVGNPMTADTYANENNQVIFAYRMGLLSHNLYQGTITTWDRCNDQIPYIYNVQSTVDYHRSFTNKSYRVLIYSGDHDMGIPHIGTEEWIESLKVGVVDDWRPWFVEDQVAGYTKKYSQNEYELTYATVKVIKTTFSYINLMVQQH
nr:serine carboxypeptidase-like 13 [Ipomoea batatas]